MRNAESWTLSLGDLPLAVATTSSGSGVTIFEILAVLLVLSGLLSYLNYRLIKLPPTIGLMALTLAMSLVLVLIGQIVPEVATQGEAFVELIDFDDTLLHGMLGFLLFAGALHINLQDLAERKYIIGLLATFGVVLSTVLVGFMMWGICSLLSLPVPPIYCFLFGALISPTDPIAVMGLLEQIGAPKRLETKIAGESLFNDGVGVVVFLAILEIAVGEQQFSLAHLGHLFLQEAIGGAVFGLGIGFLVYTMLKSVDNYQVEILLSLALVAGGYALAERIHISAPIAMVVAGLFIGNHGRTFAMSAKTCEHLDLFWELVDEILNAVLFVLIGLEVLILTFRTAYLFAGLLAIVGVLMARFIAVGIPIKVIGRWKPFEKYTVRILTWGGLRGGISVALALSIPEGTTREILLVVTYLVVVFSILVQGLTIGPLVRYLLQTDSTPTDEESGTNLSMGDAGAGSRDLM